MEFRWFVIVLFLGLCAMLVSGYTSIRLMLRHRLPGTLDRSVHVWMGVYLAGTILVIVGCWGMM